jgi:prevent-host-death family protein
LYNLIRFVQNSENYDSNTTYRAIYYGVYEVTEVKKLSISNARGHLAELVEQVAYEKETIEITRRGKVLAVLVPPEDRVLMERLEEEMDSRSVESTLKDIKKYGTVPIEKVIPKPILERSRKKHGISH